MSRNIPSTRNDEGTDSSGPFIPLVELQCRAKVSLREEEFTVCRITTAFPGESKFGSEEDEDKMRELTERPVAIVAPAGKSEVGGFDTCREYGYKYGFSPDEEEDEDPQTSNTSQHAPLLSLDIGTISMPEAFSRNAARNKNPAAVAYVLGKTYDPMQNHDEQRQDESSLFWFTYRCDFPEIQPYRITSDAGWGCMLRSAQMLLGQTLRLHYRGRDWKPPQSVARKRQDPFVRSILTWFADFPSTRESFYSLHNMVAAGLSKYEVLPGEWYGPGTAAYVIRDLVQLHAKKEPVGGRPLFRVHVASQGCVYRDAVQELMTQVSRVQREQEKRKAPPKPANVPSHPLDPSYTVEAESELEWDTALLLLIPLRLGLKSFNQDYVKSLAHTFSLRQSVGVLGGRPRGARWFYGASSDGTNVFGLDPHTVQNAPRRRNARVNGKPTSVVDMSEEYLRSVHTTNPEIYAIQRMDPSLALGFYCRDGSDFESLLQSVQTWKELNPSLPDLFTVSDTVPDYSANVSCAMSEMLMSTLSLSPGDGIGPSLLDVDIDDRFSEDDEDEYVLL